MMTAEHPLPSGTADRAVGPPLVFAEVYREYLDAEHPHLKV